MRKTVVTALVLVALFGGWLLWVRVWYESVQPAGPTLADHLAQRPTAVQARVFTANGKGYLMLFGPVEPVPRFPSGGPVYLFDGAGQLVDWTADMGDDPAFHERWPAAFPGRIITADDVAAWPGAKR